MNAWNAHKLVSLQLLEGFGKFEFRGFQRIKHELLFSRQVCPNLVHQTGYLFGVCLSLPQKATQFLAQLLSFLSGVKVWDIALISALWV